METVMEIRGLHQEALDFYRSLYAYYTSNPHPSFLPILSFSATASTLQFTYPSLYLPFPILYHSRKHDFGFEFALNLLEKAFFTLQNVEKEIGEYRILSDFLYFSESEEVKICYFLEFSGPLSTAPFINDVLNAVDEKNLQENETKIAKELKKLRETGKSYAEMRIWLKNIQKNWKNTKISELNRLISADLWSKKDENAIKDLLNIRNLQVNIGINANCSGCRAQITEISHLNKLICGHFACYDCFSAQNPCFSCQIPPEIAEFDEFDEKNLLKCLKCGELLVDSSVLFSCKGHGVCISCISEYKTAYFPCNTFTTMLCLHCNRFEESKMTENNVKMIENIENLKENYRNEPGNIEIMSILLDNFYEFLRFSENPGLISEDWSLILPYSRIKDKMYLLNCCFCKGKTVIHRRNREEMKHWKDRPFLMKCDLKVHGVCCAGCWQTGKCPVCPDSRLHDLPSASSDHPTLHVLSRCPGVSCAHPGPYRPLPNCIHRICTGCFERQEDCEICGQGRSR